MIGERRLSLRNDPAFVLAVVYTFGFLGMVFVVLVRGVPAETANVTQQLISIMSLIQGAIGGYYYGASKAQIDMQKASPDVPAVTPAAMTSSGVIPAAEVAKSKS